MNERDKLRDVIRELHGLNAEHLMSEAVHETFRGETVWDGVVEVFSVTGHPHARFVYAWSHETDKGTRRYMAVLGVPPVNSAREAVRASIAAERRRKG